MEKHDVIIQCGDPSQLECYMGWFPSLICKNYIFKDFVKPVEATSLKFCMLLKYVTLHPDKATAQEKFSNFPMRTRKPLFY